jgi:dihydrofolate synthase/folylpolyglutamate synthase
MYQRVGNAAFKKDLTNIIALCDALGNPQNDFKTIHVAGTNGKGSTSHALSAIYQNNGYKTGLYTSPHLLEFTERIKVNGTEVSQHFVINFVENIKNQIEIIQPSFFEITVSMAFSYFKEKKVDVAIIETGLGGRLDSTNIITPLLSVITTIGWDHMDMLGDTLEKIASEKAGIIKKDVPVIIGNTMTQDVEDVFHKKAKVLRAPLYKVDTNEPIVTDLHGDFQQMNVHLARKASELLDSILPVKSDLNTEALRQIKTLTDYKGRWQIIFKKPFIITDVAHNEEGLRASLYELNKIDKQKYFILGFVKEKDLGKIIPYFPKNADYHFVTPSVIRGQQASITKTTFEKFNIYGKSQISIINAIKGIVQQNENALDSICIFVGGSTFVVSDLLIQQQEIIDYLES